MSLVQSAPRFTITEANRFAAHHYDMSGAVTTLASERDQNFLLLPTDSSSASALATRPCQAATTSLTTDAYVLKIANVQEELSTLDLQNQALAHIGAKADIPIPHLLPTVTGEKVAKVEDDAGQHYFVRMLSYLPGKPLGEVNPPTPTLFHNLGSYLGKLDQALSTFAHSAAERTIQWDLRHAETVITRHINAIGTQARRSLIEQFLHHFQAETKPLLNQVRTSVIHNDANDYNILVAESDLNGTPALPQTVAGIIDFGDMVHTYTVAEPAIAAAYAMLGKANPLVTAEALVAGYHSVQPLTATELAVLYPLICMRLCMSVCLSAHQQALQPENRYLSISEAPAWALLEQLATVPPALAHYRLRMACGYPPVPQSAIITDWLRANQRSVASVIDQDLRSESVHVFDLSVGSPLVADLDDPSDTAAFTERIFADMRYAGVDVGVGRYNEARLLYSDPLFAQPSDELPERRTIHIGMDLFQPAGAPIYAPLDGAVHSYANNSGYQDYGPTIILQHTIPADEIRDTGDAMRNSQFASRDRVFYTLYGHLSEESLAGLHPGKIIKQGEQFATMGDFPINGDWPPHLHFQIITDMLGMSCGFPGVAAPSERNVWRSLCPDPNLILQIPEPAFPSPHRPKQALLATRKQRLGPSLSISYSDPLHIVRARKQFLYDVDGYRYLDVVNNVCHVGHCHPHVVRAAQRQMAVLNTNTRYIYDQLTEYAERLAATLPDPLSVCFFVNSGSEANDLALRLARAYTGHTANICLDVAYHGNLSSLIDISPYKFDGPGGKGAPSTTHVALMPDPYRGKYIGMGRETGIAYASHVQALLTDLERHQTGVAAFFAESVLGCGGQIVLPDGYLDAAFTHVRAAGGLCIADEVQVGFGRVGSHFWGFETQGVVPDIVTMGKPIGNGHPLAAVVTTPEIAAAFANGMEYFNTFGGNPVSCAIGLAVLDVIEEEQLQAHALRVGDRLMNGLRALMPSYPLIGDVRGLGLFVGAELVLDRDAKTPAGAHASYVANRMRDHGILISTDGPDHNVLKLKPPLVFDEADADRLIATLDKVLQEDAVQL